MDVFFLCLNWQNPGYCIGKTCLMTGRYSHAILKPVKPHPWEIVEYEGANTKS